MPSLHTMDTDKDTAPKKKKREGDLEEKWKMLDSEAKIQKTLYQERRVEEVQLAKVSGFPMGFQYSAESEEDFAIRRNQWKKQVESEEDYDAKEIAAERVKLDKLTMEFNQEMQRGASCYA